MKLRLKKPAWTEKRDSVRLAIECPVTYSLSPEKPKRWFKKPEPPETFKGMMQTPSMFGMRILSSREESEGTTLYLSVHLEKIRGGWETLRLRGDVVWTKPRPQLSDFLCGLRISPKSPDLDEWQRFMRGELEKEDRHEKVGFS